MKGNGIGTTTIPSPLETTKRNKPRKRPSMPSSSSEPQLHTNLPRRNDNNSTFSACLLVMDDNHYLIEWLAYHYHTLPLRYLVIAVDPRSKTSPHSILKRWHPHHMTIVQWNDTHFLPKSWLKRLAANTNNNTNNNNTNNNNILEHDSIAKFVLHRERQRNFYPTCFAALKYVGRSWTLVSDIDEFIQINPNYYIYNNNNMDPIHNHSTSTTTTTTTTHHHHHHHQRPTVIESIWDHYHQQQQDNNINNTLTNPPPCITIPRLQFGNYEQPPINTNDTTNATTTTTSTSATSYTSYAPHGFHDSDFLTLRWHWRAGLHSRKDNRNPKSIINLQQIPVQDLSREQTDAHRPVRTVCLKQHLYQLNRNSPWIIHHYIGTEQQYFFRNDARLGLKQRNRQRFQDYQHIQTAYDDSISGWLQHFVTTYGEKQSHLWLDGVGNVSII